MCIIRVFKANNTLLYPVMHSILCISNARPLISYKLLDVTPCLYLLTLTLPVTKPTPWYSTALVLILIWLLCSAGQHGCLALRINALAANLNALCIYASSSWVLLRFVMYVVNGLVLRMHTSHIVKRQLNSGYLKLLRKLMRLFTKIMSQKK